MTSDSQKLNSSSSILLSTGKTDSMTQIMIKITMIDHLVAYNDVNKHSVYNTIIIHNTIGLIEFKLQAVYLKEISVLFHHYAK